MFSPIILYSSVVANDTEASQQVQFFIIMYMYTLWQKWEVGSS